MGYGRILRKCTLRVLQRRYVAEGRGCPRGYMPGDYITVKCPSTKITVIPQFLAIPAQWRY
ncbi:hypothetical protein TH9_16270 [Thalassospira xiamenensis]|nr:hypothetical protein TH9_16270 [Thalassospira xiamenensis]